MRLLALTAIAGLALVSGSASTAHSERSQAASCISAPVHYEPGPRRDLRFLPWVSAGRPGRRVDGYLFYYREALKDSRVKSNPGLVIYTGGVVQGRYSMKILWAPRRGSFATMLVLGSRLDGPGAFTNRLHRASGVVFPSIIDIHEPGCWRLTLRYGRVSVRLAVLAIAPPS